MADDTLQRVCGLVAVVMGLSEDQVTATTSHETVSTWDSLNVINLMAALEAEFDISIAIEEWERLLSVEGILALLHEKGAA